jgi:hypothetical protein
MKKCWTGTNRGWFNFLFGYEPWGGVRPEWIILKNDRTYRSLFCGIWIRGNYFKAKIKIVNRLRSGFVDTDKFTKQFLFGMVKGLDEEMKRKIVRCCFTNGEKQCEKDAEFTIHENTRSDPDNFTFSCEGHIGKMLRTNVGFPDCVSWTVVWGVN